LNSGRPLAGVAFGLLAYGMWGFFPLFFRQLAHVPPMDVLSNRAVWACLFVGLLLSLRRQWHQVAAVCRSGQQLLMLGVAALLIGTNWLVFLWAVANQQVVASSLGYFLTPLVNVLLGLLVLKERLNRLEWLSVGLAVAAIANEIIRPRQPALGVADPCRHLRHLRPGTQAGAGRCRCRPLAGNPGHAAGVRPVCVVAGDRTDSRSSPATTR
jgi:EamA domain-containing membrane protein RarD